MPNLVSPYEPIRRTEPRPSGAGPIHERWISRHFWSWVAERITWLDAEAEKQAERDARRRAEWEALKT